MTQYIGMNEVQKKIDLSVGFSLVLLDRLAKESEFGHIECARNIFLVDATGKIVWQVHTDFDSDSGPFTNIFSDENGIRGYRWDGGVYEINLKSGKGIPAFMMK